MDLDHVLDFTLSGVRPGEAAEVTALIHSAGLPVEDLTPAKLRHFILMRRGEAIVGAVGLELAGPDALLRSLVVAEAYRHRRVAKRLVAAVERYARSLGATRLFLLTQTAEGFFQAQGYTPASRADAPPGLQETAEFRNICPASAACLSKTLDTKESADD
jgi:amino-acid N-acetyltransferase